MILQAISRAYQTMHERNWDTIYWAIDLHGVCLKSNYEQGGYQWINSHAQNGIIQIASRPENKIILWSSVYDDEKTAIIEFFEKHGIQNIIGFNQNTQARDTKVSSFHEKFYFSVLLDDKAGFDPAVHWSDIIKFYRDMRHEENHAQHQMTLDI